MEISDEKEYDKALEEIKYYFDHQNDLSNEQIERFDELSKGIEKYENGHYPICGK